MGLPHPSFEFHITPLCRFFPALKKNSFFTNFQKTCLAVRLTSQPPKVLGTSNLASRWTKGTSTSRNFRISHNASVPVFSGTPKKKFFSKNFENFPSPVKPPASRIGDRQKRSVVKTTKWGKTPREPDPRLIKKDGPRLDEPVRTNL